MTGRLPVKENDRMCAAQRPVSVDPHIGLLIAIFKNKATNCKNGTNLSSQKEKTSKGMSNRVRKSIQSPRLEFAQESLHLRPDFLLPLHGATSYYPSHGKGIEWIFTKYGQHIIRNGRNMRYWHLVYCCS